MAQKVSLDEEEQAIVDSRNIDSLLRGNSYRLSKPAKLKSL